MVEASSKALFMSLQDMFPHCSMEANLAALASGVSPRFIRVSPPVTETVYVPAAAYVWVVDPLAPSSVEPSPQEMS